MVEKELLMLLILIAQHQTHKQEARSFTIRDIAFPLLFVVWNNLQGAYYVTRTGHPQTLHQQ